MLPSRHLMDPWRDSLITELRLRSVPGERIGEALAEVDEHCADSGQAPEEAFGDAVTYAESLIAAYAPAPQRSSWRSGVIGFATLTGSFSLLNGIDAVAHDQPGQVLAGEFLFIALGTALTPVLTAILLAPRLFRRTGWWIAVAIAAPVLLGLPAALWRDPVATLPGWALLLGGLFLLAATWWPRASDNLVDRIIDPRTGAEPFATPRLVTLTIRWGFPAMLLAAAVIMALPVG